MTDIHPDDHYLEGAAVSASCHTIVVGEESGSDIRVRYDGEQLQFQHILNRKTWGNIHRPDLLHDASLSSASSSSSSLSSPSTPINNTIGGRYGAPNTICDSPLEMIDATFDWINRNLVDSVDFVVWTGDNAR